MGADMLNPGALAGATGARDTAKASEARSSDTNRRRRARQGMMAIIRDTRGERRVLVKGRVLWALRALMVAGDQGVTPISNPAPRWSAYVHKLRGLGFDIETEHEGHGGPFAGHHARYRLHSDVTLEPLAEAEAKT